MNTYLRRWGMARVKESHSFTCTPRVHPLTEWTIPAFAFPAEAGTHLPTPGFKVKLQGQIGLFTVLFDLIKLFKIHDQNRVNLRQDLTMWV